MSPGEAIGVDLGGTKVLVGVMDAERSVHYESRESSVGRTEDELIELLVSELEEAKSARPGAAAAGLGIPCTIDQRRGVAINAVNLPITDVPIRDLVSERIGLPVVIDNDANCAAFAEHRFGAARGASTAVLLTVGTGIGGGLIVGGELFRGATGSGAELGHVVIDMEGHPCQGTCPNRGCVEALASGTALAREGAAAAAAQPDSAIAANAAGGVVEGRHVTDAALAGDDVAIGVMAMIGTRIGVALSSLANVFEPEVFVIGGGVASAAGDLLLDPARAELASRALPPMNEVRVEAAELGSEAGMIGAAALALESLDGGEG